MNDAAKPSGTQVPNTTSGTSSVTTPKGSDHGVSFSSMDSHRAHQSNAPTKSVFDVGRAFNNDHVEEGTIVTDKRRQRTSLTTVMRTAFDEWWSKTTHTVEKKIAHIEAAQKKENPTIESAHERVSTIQEAAKLATQAPKDDHTIVLSKLRTFAHDAEEVTGKPFAIKEASKKETPAWQTPAPQPTVPAPKEVAGTVTNTPSTPVGTGAPSTAKPVTIPKVSLSTYAPTAPVKDTSHVVVPERAPSHATPKPLAPLQKPDPKQGAKGLLGRLLSGKRITGASTPHPTTPVAPTVTPRTTNIPTLPKIVFKEPNPTAVPAPVTAVPAPTPRPIETTPPKASEREVELPDISELPVETVSAREPIDRDIDSAVVSDAYVEDAQVRPGFRMEYLVPLIISNFRVILVGVVVVFGIGTILVISRSAEQGTVVMDRSRYTQESLIRADDERSVMYTQELRTLTELLKPTPHDGTIEHIRLSDDSLGITVELTAEELRTTLLAHAPEAFVRSLHPAFMIGRISDRTQSGFLILKSAQFDNAFAGMLAWEPTLLTDIAPLIPIQGRTDLRFEDALVNNRSIRIYYGEAGNEVLVYALMQNGLIIITTNTEALSTLIDRIK